MVFGIFKSLRSLLLLAGWVSASVHADIDWHWEDSFSAVEQEKLKSWITHTVSGLESLVAPFPFDLDIHFYRLTNRGEPVPWANTRRGDRQGVTFYVDPAFSQEAFYADWTASHELSHLLLPPLGEENSWFAEGFASYMQYQLMRHMGQMDAVSAIAAYRERMGRARSSYRLCDTPLAAAAQQLRRAGDYPTYYWGGAVYFLRADTALRQRGDGELSSLLSEYMACCRRQDWSLARLVQEFDQLVGMSLFTDLLREFREEPGFPQYGAALDSLEAQLHRR